eukprot:892484-Amphidinium_carterae.1
MGQDAYRKTTLLTYQDGLHHSSKKAKMASWVSSEDTCHKTFSLHFSLLELHPLADIFAKSARVCWKQTSIGD